MKNKTPSSLKYTFGDKAAAQLASDVKKIIGKIKKSTLPSEPLYLFEPTEVRKSINEFQSAFRKAGLKTESFFALKSNPYSGLLKEVVRAGVGVDVSSRQELAIAVKAKAKKIIVTGPAKSVLFFKQLARTKSVTRVYLESEVELQNLKTAIGDKAIPFNVGVRIVPSEYASWDKFGISLTALAGFLKIAAKLHVSISAVQFHISYVKDANTHARALKEVALYAQRYLTVEQCAAITSIDIGGGFTPFAFEADYPWNKKGYSLFDIEKIKDKILAASAKKRATFKAPAPIGEIALSIANTWKKSVKPVFPRAGICTEPGRFFSHRAMHILLTVADRKSQSSVILNGGWNMLGWEKYQYVSYVPAFNIDNLSFKSEVPCLLYGNLCLPDDIWGYHLHANRVQVGDRILLPFQGAYTYTFRQDFIRGIPAVVQL